MQKKRNGASAVQKPTKPVAKPEVKPKPGVRVANPSEKLANLLRKEGVIAARVRKSQGELKAVQAEISKTWEERQQQSKELLRESPES